MDANEAALRIINDRLDDLPIAAPDRPIEQWETADILADTARQGLLKLREIISQPLDMSDLKQLRIVGDLSLGVGKLYARVQESAMRQNQWDGWRDLFAQIEAKEAAEGPLIDAAPVEAALTTK